MGCFVRSSLDARSKKLDHLSCQSSGGTPFGVLHGWVWVVYNGTGANDGCLALLMKFLVCASPLRQKGAPYVRLPDHHPPSSKPRFLKVWAFLRGTEILVTDGSFFQYH